MGIPPGGVGRRDFLVKMGRGAGTMVAGTLSAGLARASQAAGLPKKYGMVIDTNRCTMCHGCTIACISENNVPHGHYRSWVKVMEKGMYPWVSRHALPRLCNNCQDAPYLNLCPTGATYRTPQDGVVHVNRKICVGCRICVEACPYGSRFVNPLTNTADKCDFCYHRITAGLKPACVDACTGRARIFGDLNDPSSEVSRYMAGKACSVCGPIWTSGPEYIMCMRTRPLWDPIMTGCWEEDRSHGGGTIHLLGGAWHGSGLPHCLVSLAHITGRRYPHCGPFELALLP